MPCDYPYSVGPIEENKNLSYEAFGTDPLEILYQRRCANFIYVVPSGLRELLTDISREVLREHPSNVHTFIADYLHSLMVTRENAKIAIKLVEDLGDTAEMLADFMKHTNLTRYQIDKSAGIIQRTFRRLVKQRKYERTAVVEAIGTEKIKLRLKVTLEEANQAATVIQRAYHTYKLRQERKFIIKEEPDLHMPFRHIDWQIAAQRTYDIFQHTRPVRMSELHKAAKLIQAAYRGYYTRKYVKDYFILRKKDKAKLKPDDDCIKRKKDLAARVLQRFFRRIVEENKKKRTMIFSISKQSSTDSLVQEEFRNLQNILVLDKHLIKTTEEEVSLRSATSEDFEQIRQKSARIIQRFFRKVVAMRKTKFPYEITTVEHVKDIDSGGSEIFELDTEIENIFEEEENEYFII